MKSEGLRGEINIIDFYRIIMKMKRWIISFVATFTLLVLVGSFFLTDIYKAEAAIIPVEIGSQGKLSAIASQMGMLGGLIGGVSEDKNEQKLIMLLRSRTLAERVIERLNLVPLLISGEDDRTEYERKRAAIRKLRKKMLYIKSNKNSGIINISIEFRDPEWAKRLVTEYLKELQVYIRENALTSAKRNRFFVAKQLEKNKQELLEVGKKLNVFYNQQQVSSVAGTVDVQIELAENKLLLNDRLDILSEKKEKLISKLEGAVINDSENGKITLTVPQQVFLEYLTMHKKVLAEINGLMAQQYEMAKIEEAKNELAFQVIDAAILPLALYKPKRALMTALAFFSSLFFIVFVVLFREYLEGLKEEN